jgi:hypothetical protein
VIWVNESVETPGLNTLRIFVTDVRTQWSNLISFHDLLSYVSAQYWYLLLISQNLISYHPKLRIRVVGVWKQSAEENILAYDGWSNWEKKRKMHSMVRGKAVPLHTIEAEGWRGNIIPTRSRPRHQIGWVFSVTPRPRFTPGERTPGTNMTGGWVGPRAGLDKEAS